MASRTGRPPDQSPGDVTGDVAAGGRTVGSEGGTGAGPGPSAAALVARVDVSVTRSGDVGTSASPGSGCVGRGRVGSGAGSTVAGRVGRIGDTDGSSGSVETVGLVGSRVGVVGTVVGSVVVGRVLVGRLDGAGLDGAGFGAAVRVVGTRVGAGTGAGMTGTGKAGGRGAICTDGSMVPGRRGRGSAGNTGCGAAVAERTAPGLAAGVLAGAGRAARRDVAAVVRVDDEVGSTPPREDQATQPSWANTADATRIGSTRRMRLDPVSPPRVRPPAADAAAPDGTPAREPPAVARS